MQKRTDSAEPSRARTNKRKSTDPGVPRPDRELSAYESLERRSRELEDERAHGGFGTSQPPDAAVPLLHSSPSDDGPASKAARPRRKAAAKRSPGVKTPK